MHWKKQTTLPSFAYAGIPYQSFGVRAGDGEISFLDLRITHDPDNARNKNQGSKGVYFVLAQGNL
jgi:hypothetical protein